MNKFERVIEDAKAGFAENPTVKPVRQTFAEYDKQDHLCGACALTAAYVKYNPDALKLTQNGDYLDGEVAQWAMEQYGLTHDEAASFTSGFDGWSRVRGDADAYEAGKRVWEEVKR